MSLVLDYHSLIDPKYRFERDKVSKTEEEGVRGDCLAKVEEEA